MKRFVCLLVFALLCPRVWAEEVLRLSFGEVERMFLTQNLALLAEHYSIGIAEAQAAQAKV